METRLQDWGKNGLIKSTSSTVHFHISLALETPGPPLMTSEGKQYSTTAEPKMNASNPSENNTDNFELKSGVIIYISVISSIEIPSICLAIYAVYSLIKSKQAAAVFVMNLLISDLIQIFCM